MIVVLGVLVATVAPASGMLAGVDVASWQHPTNQPIDWGQVRYAGYTFAFIKASEATNYRNPWFGQDFAGAANAGMYRGAYHYARPALPMSTAIDQARYFVSTTGTMGGPLDLGAVLDLEETGGLGQADLAQWARTWLGEVERLTGRPPIVYTGYYFWRDALGNPTDIGSRYRLWLPSYPADPNSTTFRPLVPAGWSTWTYWQYSSTGAVPGIVGNVDLNRFCCDSGSLASLAGSGRGAGNPFGNLEMATRLPGAASVTGWVIDPDTTDPVDVHFYVDGQWGGSARAGADRPDVGGAYTGFGIKHGLSATVPVGSGARQICAYAINVGSGSTNPLLGCASLVANPFGNLDSAAMAPDGSVLLNGWALDPDAPSPLAIHVYVNGAWGGATTTTVARPDVARAYPGAGGSQGFQIPLYGVGPGTQQVCAYAINIGSGTGNPSIGCRSVTVPPMDPVGSIDAAGAGLGNARLSGWALDFDSSAPITLHAYVDGQWGGSYTADAPRPDVGAFLSVAPNHGFDITFPLATGSHQICLYGINVGRGTTNPSIGCRTVTVGADPVGTLDTVSRSGDVVRFAGWTIDPDTSAPVAVHAYVNGQWGGAYLADKPRSDVGAAYPAYGSAHGFTIDLRIPGTGNQVCLYLINVGRGSTNPQLTCRTV